MLSEEFGTPTHITPTPGAVPSRIELPAVPAELRGNSVAVWSEPLVIDTYLPLDPDAFPAFLEQRVYQGSSGRVYPLPFHERISQTKQPHAWEAIHLENEWLRIVILPELGGRIHIGYDKAADYDFLYRNNVIKPALVGLAGPWISGGVEFNWPQHHRPATFLPTDVEIEHEDDGSVTVWCSDHDPFTRMKGMHGIRLRPDSAVLEARVRLYNRTEETQTFLWWANVAAAVGDDYQSFFPTDVHHVADHAKRAVATFPRVEGRYYGVDYAAQRTPERPDADRLDWYRNIPVPTSYMVMHTEDDFFGGYDHGRGAGFVHWADRHIAPGKKQWTWGNAPFGWAWDANLTDDDGPYVELMAGAFTDNQPDFSYIAPGETKTFSQFWYPIQAIGPAHQANLRAAVSLRVQTNNDRTEATIGLSVTEAHPEVSITLVDAGGATLVADTAAVSPGIPYLETHPLPAAIDPSTLTLIVAAGGDELLRYTPRAASVVDATPPGSATEPPAPADVATVDELFYIGQYLQQYRHATRFPEPYWREALSRDRFDVRSNIALAERLGWAGDLDGAEELLRTAISRLTSRVPNPADGEAHYRLGIVLVRQGRDTEAEELLAKATWNSGWRVAAHVALARLKARDGRVDAAVLDARAALRLDGEHLQAADILATLLRGSGEAGRAAESQGIARATLLRDPLDQWARDLVGLALTADAPTLLDIALEYSSLGFFTDALRLLDLAAEASTSTALGQVQVAPLVQYHRAVIFDAMGHPAAAVTARNRAAGVDRRFALASRGDDARALQVALAADPADPLAATLLGNWLYDKRRYTDAIGYWEQALSSARSAASDADSDLTAATAHRNLGIAAYNVLGDGDRARAHYASALAISPDDAKLWYESDQLAARLGEQPTARRARLDARRDIVAQRDDLTVVYANLLTETGDPAAARALLAARQFQPWEGGEGQALGAWENATASLARAALESGDSAGAVSFVRSALDSPATLGEARHALANSAGLYLLLGDALEADGHPSEALAAWERSASFTGDFLQMSTQAFSAQTYSTVLALRRLGRTDEANELTAQLAAHVEVIAAASATIDYFATSLPTMLLFTEDPQAVRAAEVAVLREQISTLERTSTPAPTAPPAPLSIPIDR